VSVVLTAQAEALTVPRTTALSVGVIQEMDGAACAASGSEPQAINAATAIGVLRSFNGLSLVCLEIRSG
jgi:hypothetical protein